VKVERWMSSPALTVTADVPASLALRKMMENEIRRLPVVDDDGDLVGLVTDRDLRTALPPHGIPRLAEEYRPGVEDPPVGDIMRRAVAVVSPGDNIRDVAELMHNHRITGLPVVQGRRCVGVITVQDLLEVLMVALDKHSEAIAREVITAREGRGP
jgi:acetoin utilization protein AcuB